MHMSKLNLPYQESKEPVHMDEQGWWYWCVDGKTRGGAFPTQYQAEIAYNHYRKFLLSYDSEPKPAPKEPIQQDGKLWYWWHGGQRNVVPYATQAKAEDAYNHYCATLLGQEVSERQTEPTGVTKMEEHAQADIFRAMADNKKIEGRKYGDRWDEMKEPWLFIGHPEWELRVKVPMLIINGIECREPVSKPLNSGQEYWGVVIDSIDQTIKYNWSNHELDWLRLDRGLIQLTREDAMTQAKAMLLSCVLIRNNVQLIAR